MINHESIIEILRSNEYVDKSGCFAAFIPGCYETLQNCSGTGSSLFIKTLACFLDNAVDTKDIFLNLRIGQDNDLLEMANRYRVLYLDFSDFKAHDYEEAISYLRRKMSMEYKYFYNELANKESYLYSWRSYNETLDIIEGTASDHVLQQSLHKIMLQLRGFETTKNEMKLAVLIDNMVQLETVAAKYGYSKDMDEFLKEFIVEDVYKYCDIFLQISDIEEDTPDSWFHSIQYMVHRYFSVPLTNVRERFLEMIVDRSDQIPFHYDALEPDTANWSLRIADGRKTVMEAKEEEERCRQEHICQEKARYAIDLLPTTPRFSPNMGMRVKHLDKSLPRYEVLNTCLRELYMKASPIFDTDNLYAIMQKIDYNIRNVKDVKKMENDLMQLSSQHPFWKDASVNTSGGHWVQVTYRRKTEEPWKSPATPENIKVYAYVGDGTAQSVFIDSIRYLLAHAKQVFAAKLAVIERADQMCYWINPEDYPCIERFFEPLSESLEVSMPFVAYKGKLGISKDFPGTDASHNLAQAHILSDYFKTISGVDEVDLEDMYNNYIAKWNADIYEENPWGFKGHSALSFVVILDTLDAILKGGGIDGNSSLLSNEGKVWRTLAQSRCWADFTAPHSLSFSLSK